MDNSKEFQMMLNKAIISEPLIFADFDRTKNVQDQLQEMVVVGSHPMPITNLGWRFQTFFNEQYSELNQATPTALFPSFEQLWLAFVCKELYQKSWDGSDWIES